MNVLELTDKGIFFLSLHAFLFITYLFINLILMRFKKECWNGLPEDDCYTIIDAFYYTSATHTSIGFGDITPRTRLIRIISSIHMILAFSLIILEI